MDKNIIKIQRYYRFYKTKEIIQTIRELKLSNKSTTFSNFTKIMQNKDIKSKIMNLILKLNNIDKCNITEKIILSGYFIHLFPKELICDNNDIIEIDKIILDWSNQLVNIIEKKEFNNYQDIKKLLLFLNNYNYIFKNWKNFDANRTIEGLIISFNYRKEHLNKVLDSNEQNKEEIIAMLNEQCENIKLSINMIDKNFDVDYLENNYKQVLDDMKNSYNKIYKAIKYNFDKAYFNYLCDELKKDNNLVFYDILKKINNMILVISPKKYKNSIEEKLNEYNYTNMLLNSEWNNELLDYLRFIIDTISMFAAPIDNKSMVKLKKEFKKIVKTKYLDNFPKLILNIEKSITRIYELIINL